MMDQSFDFQDAINRIDNLERRCRRLVLLLAISVVIGAAALFCVTLTWFRSRIPAQSIVFSDELGNKTTELSIEGKAAFGLILTDNKNAGAIRFGLSRDLKDVPTIELFDRTSKSRIVLGILENAPAIQMFDNTGNIRLSFGLSKNGAYFTMFDDKGQPVIPKPG